DFEQSIAQKRNAHDCQKQRNVFAKQRSGDLAPAALVGCLRGQSSRLVGRWCDRVLQAIHHSITSSARATKLLGILRPRAFAVLRLMLTSSLLGCCTGNSAGFAPLRMRSTYPAARRIRSTVSTA